MTFFIPKVRHHHQYPYWYTPKLRHLFKRLHSLRKKVSKNPTPYLCNKLEKKTSNLCDQIQSAKSLYEARLVANFAGNSNSKIYDYIRSLSSSGTIPSTVFLNSASATSDTEKVALFNTFFHSVYKPSFSNPSLQPSSQTTLTNPNISNISLQNLR